MPRTAKKTERTKSVQLCMCGCGKRVNWNKLRRVVGSDNAVYYVTNECLEGFKTELSAFETIQKTVHCTRQLWFFQRFKFANLFFNSVIRMHIRHTGQPQAIKTARRATTLYLVPKWLSPIIERLWKQPVPQ